MKSYIALFGILVLCTSQIVIADEDGISSNSSPMIVNRKVVVKNLERKWPVAFWIRKSGENWVKYFLNPSQADDFPCGEQCDIHVGVKGKTPVERRLIQNQALWDILGSKKS